RTFRDFKVFLVIRGDLQEHALCRAALVVLAGGVQEARTPAESDWTASLFSQQIAQRGKFLIRSAVQVRLDGQVAVCRQLCGELLQRRVQGLGLGAVELNWPIHCIRCGLSWS